MKTTLTQTEWERICYLIENECKPEAHVGLEGSPEEGYCVVFRGGVMHPAAFLDLFDGEAEENV